jgi:transposase
MESIGIDVHKKHSQICVLDGKGQVRAEERIPTRAKHLRRWFEEHPKAKVLVESSTDSEWVARVLEEMGMEVVVADPNYALMYATRDPRVKTDKRDARALAEALRLGHYRKAHRPSPAARRRRIVLGNRERLMGCRTGLLNRLRSVLRQEGVYLKSCAAEAVPRAVKEAELPEELLELVRPLVDELYSLNDQLEACDRKLKEEAKGDALGERLQSAPGVGLVTALAFMSVVDGAARFKNAHALEHYLGLVPGADESGEKKHTRGRPITKRGNRMLRWLLVEAGHRILNGRGGSPKLRAWGERIATRGGKGKAAVALARKLAGILYAMWRDGTKYSELRYGNPPATTAQAKRAEAIAEDVTKEIWP